LTIAARGQAEPLPLDRAIRLALAHSTGSAIANADVQRAFASYRELRNNFVPQLVAGSGLGWTYGYPLSIQGSPPSLLDVVAQSSIFNPAQRQFLGAAKIDWQAAQFQDKDQRNAVIQDVALTYAELAKWEARLARLQDYEAEARKLEQAVTARLQEGVDSAVDLNKAKLGAARVRLHQAEARGSADVLRRHLSTLTGLPVSSIELAPETIPALPSIARKKIFGKGGCLQPALKFAEQHSLAESMRAAGEHRSLLPTIDFSAQYARFSTFNHYAEYLPKARFNRTTPPSAWPPHPALQRQPARPLRRGRGRSPEGEETSGSDSQSGGRGNAKAAARRRTTRGRARGGGVGISTCPVGLEAAQTRVDARPARCMSWPMRACKPPNGSCFSRMRILNTSASA